MSLWVDYCEKWKRGFSHLVKSSPLWCCYKHVIKRIVFQPFCIHTLVTLQSLVRIWFFKWLFFSIKQALKLLARIYQELEAIVMQKVFYVNLALLGKWIWQFSPRFRGTRQHIHSLVRFLTDVFICMFCWWKFHLNFSYVGPVKLYWSTERRACLKTCVYVGGVMHVRACMNKYFVAFRSSMILSVVMSNYQLY